MDTKNIRNENSPLEVKMEAALKQANIKYKSQYTIYDTNKDKWNAKYTLDFLVYGEYCKIAIECDGNTYHSSESARERDLRRDLWVKKFGFDDTLRFNTEQIKYNMSGIIKQISDMIVAYDKIKYDKRKKYNFNIDSISSKVPKIEAKYIAKDLTKDIQKICVDAHKHVKINNRKKQFIVNALRKVIFEAGFADIHNSFGSFKAQQLESYKGYTDVYFGAYNIPCCFLVGSTLKEINIPTKMANDRSLLKIIILYDSPKNGFVGKSYIIFNGSNSNKNMVVGSDLISYSKEDYDSNDYERLLEQASKLERQLKGFIGVFTN